MKNLIFGAGDYPQTTNLGLLFFRVFIGLSMAFAHGLGKVPPSEGVVAMVSGLGFPAPWFFAWLTAFAEFGCGLLIALGLATRPAAFILAINMAVAGFIFHAADPFKVKELALAYLFSAVALCFTGAGKFSVDSIITHSKP